uniref:Tubulin-tyrosine ligase n=1 Tax=Arcella intermedia TaxID=1963864 RepID=A0A6B2L464_9EUKA
MYSATTMPRIVRYVLNERGWTRTPNDTNNWTLKWKCGSISPSDYRNALNHQILNHFPETRALTKKGSLQYTMKLSHLKYPNLYNFTPTAFTLTEYSLPLLQKYFGNKNKIWIGKPAAWSQGRGITITRNLEDFLPSLVLKPPAETLEELPEASTGLGEDEAAAGAAASPSQELQPHFSPYMVIIQEYIQNAHLIGGYKHDMRIYVLITSLAPLRVYLYNEGLARFSTQPYSLDDLDTLRHLTNTSIHHSMFQSGKLDPAAQEVFSGTVDALLGPGDFSKRCLSSVFGYLAQGGVDARRIWREIQKVILLTVLPIAKNARPSHNQKFELLGFDIILTDDLKPHLIEVNLGPSLAIACQTDIIIKKALVEDIFNIVFSTPPNSRRFPSLHEDNGFESDIPKSSGDFELIFPFNENTYSASSRISQAIESDENYDLIMDEIDKMSPPPSCIPK